MAIVVVGFCFFHLFLLWIMQRSWLICVWKSKRNLQKTTHHIAKWKEIHRQHFSHQIFVWIELFVGFWFDCSQEWRTLWCACRLKVRKFSFSSRSRIFTVPNTLNITHKYPEIIGQLLPLFFLKFYFHFALQYSCSHAINSDTLEKSGFCSIFSRNFTSFKL